MLTLYYITSLVTNVGIGTKSKIAPLLWHLNSYVIIVMQAMVAIIQYAFSLSAEEATSYYYNKNLPALLCYRVKRPDL